MLLNAFIINIKLSFYVQISYNSHLNICIKIKGLSVVNYDDYKEV